MISRFMPLVIFFEVPFALLIILGVFKYKVRLIAEKNRAQYFPFVTCIITCYSEGRDIQTTIRSITEQLYPGKIQILAIIDGATDNKITYNSAMEMNSYVKSFKNRELLVIPKWKREGRVSSLNAGMNYTDGEIILALDGDTSFDNNMLERATRHFEDTTVRAVSGCLRVRNAEKSIVTQLQAIEYFVSIQSSKTGLSSYNVVNNISGAFGVFRKSMIDLLDGWDA